MDPVLVLAILPRHLGTQPAKLAKRVLADTDASVADSQLLHARYFGEPEHPHDWAGGRGVDEQRKDNRRRHKDGDAHAVLCGDSSLD